MYSQQIHRYLSAVLRTQSSHPAQSKLVIIHAVCACSSSIFVWSSSSRMFTNSCMLSSHKHTHTHTHTPSNSASWFALPFLPFLPPVYRAAYGWMDGSVHTSPLPQTHPCCYIRAMQRLTNQIIIATGHTLGKARVQWSNMAKRWTDAGKGTIAPPSCLGTHPVSLHSNSLNWATSLWLVHCWFVGFF